RGGGLLALALVVTYPDVLGHGALVTTDVPLAAFGLPSGFAPDQLVRDGRGRWLLLLGLALGGALAVKFSAIFLAAGLAVAAGVATTLGPERAAAGPADPFGRGGAGTRLGALVLACLIVGALTALILTISYLGHEPFTAYRRGLASIYSNWSPTYRGLCLGRYEPKFWYYFLVAVEREHPFHASSVNALGGAPGSFYRLLDDSNQDWGQGLKALARWQRERDVPRITLLSSLLVDGARPPRRLRRGGGRECPRHPAAL